MALNSSRDYQGGQLAFFVDHGHRSVYNGQDGRQLSVLVDRPAGSMVKYPRGILNGVTALHSGTRKSLFVVDQGDNLTAGVFDATDDHVGGFLACKGGMSSPPPKVSKHNESCKNNESSKIKNVLRRSTSKHSSRKKGRKH